MRDGILYFAGAYAATKPRSAGGGHLWGARARASEPIDPVNEEAGEGVKSATRGDEQLTVVWLKLFCVLEHFYGYTTRVFFLHIYTFMCTHPPSKINSKMSSSVAEKSTSKPLLHC